MSTAQFGIASTAAAGVQYTAAWRERQACDNAAMLAGKMPVAMLRIGLVFFICTLIIDLSQGGAAIVREGHVGTCLQFDGAEEKVIGEQRRQLRDQWARYARRYDRQPPAADTSYRDDLYGRESFEQAMQSGQRKQLQMS